MFFQTVAYLRRVEFQYRAPDHDHHIAWWQTMFVFTKTFAENSFQPVSLIRVRHLLFGDRKTQAGYRATGFSDQYSYAGIALTKIVFE